jgi:hypothetical protein
MNEYNVLYKQHQCCGKQLKCTHKLLLVFVMITSAVLGSNGIMIQSNANESDQNNNTTTFTTVQSTIMILISIITVVLQHFEFEKNAHRQRTLADAYNSLAKKIQIQLALPRPSRQNFVEFVEKIEKTRQYLEKCYAINIDSNAVTPS